MSFNGSGTYTLPLADVVTGTTISSSWANTTLGNIATNGLTMCIAKDGQTTTTSAIPFAAGLTSTTGSFTSTLNTTTGALQVKGQAIQCFTLQITNTAGTLQHKITSDIQSAALGNFSAKINAASATLQNTPTGADASTAMAFGGKISSANTNVFILDTAAQVVADQVTVVSISRQTTGGVVCTPQFLSRDVNGTVRIRLELFFSSAASPFALTTANISAGDILEIRFFGMLA